MKKHPIPDILIEQLLLGELPEARARQLAADPQVQARLAELQASNREILQRYPPQVMARRIGWRLQQERENPAPGRAAPRRWSLPRLAPVAGFAVLLLAVGLVLATVAPRREDGVRLKGLRAHLVVYRQTGAGAEALRADSAVRAGDVLQIGYVGAGGGYGVIFSIDGNGVLTLHYPASTEAGSRLEAQGEVLLDYAYRLDDAPGFERFFLVTSEREPPLEEVLAAGRRLASDPRQARRGHLDLPAGLQQWSLLLAKQ